ncbi:carbon-nitrogen hydrolase family protein [Cognatiyoonia sp. IB215182]|uniref:carbon-nitrogen hydrolase family protein n=1 Tax=Cognatiyoonia sp. IB215182 TaxID=3097353 RepID=UPI002A0E75E0|nr:carbon-nitrogen hydrolase family protein [Cognatiyoonia sp. IB215182]MDX8353059.1 carbon-nitrogen hydrolase family protein [Cognatiyoonia sp. IB215182]
MKAALLQLNVSDDPASNLPRTVDMIAEAAGKGAGFVLTPEVTNCVSQQRKHQARVLQQEADDPTLHALREAAIRHGIWLSIGSLALKTDDPDGRFANRSFLIDPAGQIVARYDKIHMFDVTVSDTETYRESAGYRPGTHAVVADTPFAKIGLSICYDIRFAYLYRALAQAGAEVLLVPSAFSPVTGAAHWEPLLRARAIETGSYVLAAAQTGTHAAQSGKARTTYGHSMAISPWGEVLLDMGTDPGMGLVDLSLAEVAQSRKRIAALSHDRPFEGP